jgi:hypothetical protein
MPDRSRLASPIILALGSVALTGSVASAQEQAWRIHDMDRPRPQAVTPAANPGGPPSDAVVLFEGDLSGWVSGNGSDAAWKVENGYFEVVPGSGPIRTRRGFGDVQLHLEFMTPPPKGMGQGRGNSGVFFMAGAYEIQVLDSYQNDTYPDGQAGAVYGQQPPLVNASLPPGEWQRYDIVFRRPRFAAGGELESPARFTVFHNGILVQDGVEATGPTTWQGRPPYSAHPDALPIELQDHGNPMRFRNIWVRELPAPPSQPRRLDPPTPALDDAARYAGSWGNDGTAELRLVEQDGGLWLYRGARGITSLRPDGENRLVGTRVGVTLVFSHPDSEGRPARLEHSLGRATGSLVRIPE